ncbi:MAG: hypothetical protein M0P64_01810 [Candidatus Pacebacteria bacterium]|jgi:hypothetical protein|nr:hypothetical protein [Candidatus Paceibacterota bacterium]
MEINDIQEQIQEKKKLLAENAGFLGQFILFDKEKISAEIDTLESQKQFLLNQEQIKNSEKQADISKKVGFRSIVVALLTVLASVGVAVWVPAHQRGINERAQIEAVYKNLITNQDIFISNSNERMNLMAGEGISSLPESYIEDSISDDARKTLQNTFGLIQYRFFLYYIQQTALLNEEIKLMRADYINKDTKSFVGLNATKKYLATMEYLTHDDGGKIDTKFDYQMDTECLVNFFEINFSFLTIDGRGRAPKCQSASLNRIFNLGYLPADTPDWLRPELKRALNDREDGLGDHLISTQK